MEKRNNRLYWHVHHDKLWECMDIEQERIDYIKKYKPPGEIDLRLKLMKPIRGKLPRKLMAAGTELDAAWAKWEAAWAEWDAVRAKLDAARAERDAALAKWGAVLTSSDVVKYMEKLHKKECPNCPWDEKEETIFPKRRN